MHFAAEREGTKPYMPFAGQGDLPTGCYLAMGVMAAYINKLRTGVGDMVTANLYGAGIWARRVPHHHRSGALQCSWPKDPMDTFSPLYNIYKCADATGLPSAATAGPGRSSSTAPAGTSPGTPTIPGMIDAYMNGRKLSEEMERWIATKNYDEVDAILSDCDIPHDVCQSYREVAQDNVAMEADLMQEISYPRSGSTVRIPAPPIHFHEAGLPETTTAASPARTPWTSSPATATARRRSALSPSRRSSAWATPGPPITWLSSAEQHKQHEAGRFPVCLFFAPKSRRMPGALLGVYVYVLGL